MATKHFRFCVGSAEGRRSAVYKVWVRGNDAYLHSEWFASELKISFHASGQCHLSQTSEWVAKEGKPSHGRLWLAEGSKPNRGRHRYSWVRPAGTRGVAAYVLCVVIPESELRVGGWKEIASDTIWLPAPTAGADLRVDFHLTGPVRWEPEAWYAPPGYGLLPFLPLADGGALAVVYRFGSVTPQLQAQFEGMRVAARAREAQRGRLLAPDARGFGWGVGDSGARILCEIAPVPEEGY